MITFEKMVNMMTMQPVVYKGYVYFKNYYKVIAADLIKQQALYSDPKCNTKN